MYQFLFWHSSTVKEQGGNQNFLTYVNRFYRAGCRYWFITRDREQMIGSDQQEIASQVKKQIYYSEARNGEVGTVPLCSSVLHSLKKEQDDEDIQWMQFKNMA